jgi:hypothetical protein
MPIPATRIVDGALPPGVELSPRGTFDGVPTTPGTFEFTVEISDGCSARRQQRRLRVVPAPILLAEAESLEFHCPQGALPFSGGLVRVSGSAPGHPYSVDLVFPEDKPWLAASLREGRIPTESSAFDADTLSLTINASKLAPGLYSARLRVSAWQGANAPELLFRLRVDSPQSVFAPIAAPPQPIPVTLFIAEAPSPILLSPPQTPRRIAPLFPKYVPKPKSTSQRGKAGAFSPGRSRVLPFPKVTITPAKPEPPPERTKPAAMPPAKPSAMPPAKPAAH